MAPIFTGFPFRVTDRQRRGVILQPKTDRYKSETALKSNPLSQILLGCSEGVREVSQLLTIANKLGEERVNTPLNFPDIICQ